MAGKWTDLPEELIRWRQEMIECVLGFETDTVVFLSLHCDQCGGWGGDRR